MAHIPEDKQKEESTLVLFTESYPFSSFSEKAFIEPGLGALTSRFGRVLIVPRNRRANKTALPSHPALDYSTFWLDNAYCKCRWLRIKYAMKSFFGFDVRHEKQKKQSLTFGMSVLAMKKSLEKWMEREKLDFKNTVFYTFWFDEWTAALALLSEERGRELKIATRVHSFYETSERAHYLKRLAGRGVSLFIPASLSAESRLRTILPDIDPEKINTIYLGSHKIGCTDKKGRQKNILTFFTACRLDPEKSIWMMLEFMDALAIARGHQIKWIVAGDGQSMNDFQIAVANNRNENLTIELLGAIENSQVHDILRSGTVDWTLLLSPDEGLPIILCESIAYGVPVIANDVGGVGEVVTDETGLLLASDPEKEEFIRGIAPYLDSDVRYKALAESAEEYWRKNFDASILREKSAEILKELL